MVREKQASKEQEVVRKLRTRFAKLSKLLKKLDETEGGKILVDYIKNIQGTIDENWHYVTDEKALNNIRCNKMAVQILLDCFKVASQEAGELEKKIYELEERPSSITRDYDPD